MSPRVGGSVFPAQGELVVVFVDVARQRHQVDVDLLQVVGAAGLLLDGRAAGRPGGGVGLVVDGGGADGQAVGRVDLDQAGRVHDLCGGVVGHDGVDHRTRFFVVLEGDE